MNLLVRRGRPSPAHVLALAIAGTVLGVLPVFLLGGLAVQMRRDLAFSTAELGLVVATFFAFSALFSIPGGWFSERIGPGRGILLGGLAALVCSMGIATSTRSLLHLVIFIALAGAGNGVTQPACNLALTRFVPSRRQGLAFGVKQASAPTATLLAGLAVPVIALTAEWRYAYLATAVVATLLCTSVILQPLRIEAVRRHWAGRATAAGKRSLAYLATAGGLAAGAGNSLGAFLVLSSVEAGVSHTVAGLTVALGSACGVAARVLSGYLSNGRPATALRTVVWMLVLGSAGFALLSVADHAAIRLIAALLAFGAGWGWPALFVLAVVRAYPDAPAAATGLTQTGVYLGCVFGPLLFGLLVNVASYGLAWLVTAGTVLVAVALISWVVRSPDPA